MTLTNFEKNNQTLKGTTTKKVCFLTEKLESTRGTVINIHDFDQFREK